MSNSSSMGRFVVAALVAAPVFAAALFLATPDASANSCRILADMLSHQNTPLQDAKTRLTTCAKKYAKYDDSLASRTKSEWQKLCEADKRSAYQQLVDNRETILRRCQPRGSDE